MAGLGGADEGDFLELIIANERVLQWIELLELPGNPKRKKEVILELQAVVESKPTYAEEARKAGAVQVLTGILSRTEDPSLQALRADEEVMEAISRIITACSGPQASGGKVNQYEYSGVGVRIREGALGDGLGAKVWTVAHILCKEMAAHPGFVAGRQVLEIGAGCGVCGILAAKLGAEHVVLTDVEGPVLRNLRDCMHMNAPAAASSSRETSGSQQQQQGSGQAAAGGRDDDKSQQLEVDDKELFDDAESVDDLDFGALLVEDGGAGAGGRAGGSGDAEGPPKHGSGQQAWQVGNMSVRTLDWLESLQALGLGSGSGGGQAAGEWAGAGTAGGAVASGEAGASGAAGAGETAVAIHDPKAFYANDLLRMDDAYTLPGEMPPSVPLAQQYSCIIGTDIMYEPMHAKLVAAVLAHRLAPGGAALLCCAVRQPRTFAAFTSECAARGLRYRRRQVHPAKEYEGILGREEDYEGFLLMAVDHAASPSSAWHRDDWEQ